jgi:predicted ferric reductase
MIAAIGSSSQLLWYATRGTGVVALVLLTLTLVLGVAQVARWAPAGSPRFVVNAVHRNTSLLAIAFVAVHVATTVLDTYVHISLVAAFVPFTGSYRRLWLGLGAVALDLMLALIATSLVRDHLRYGAWRLVHWTAYLCWPIALVHGLGTGTDRLVPWVLALDVVCTAAVSAAVVWRLAAGTPPPPGRIPSPPPGRSRQVGAGERAW